MRIGSDTGGTFTDLVDDRGRVAKVLSTPEDPTAALSAGIEQLKARRVDLLAHGTTVATNALLEGELAPTALVTTAGFADVIEIARQDRPRLYDPEADRPTPLVDRDHRLEVVERLAADGSELEPVGEVPEVPDGGGGRGRVPAPRRPGCRPRGRGGHRPAGPGPRGLGVPRGVAGVP